MPKKIQNIEELQNEVGQSIANPRQKGFQKMKSKGGTAIRPLDALQRKALSQLRQQFYVYNVSPIFNHRRRASNVNFFIARRKPAEKVSTAMVVRPAAVRYVIKGEGVAEPVITLGEDLVRDVLGLYNTPNSRGQNLTEAGCFYTSTPLEDLPEEERGALIENAEEAHRVYCSKKVLEADEWWGDQKMKSWIVKRHRDCANFLNEEREWVTRKAPPKAPVTAECKWCGYANRLGVAICFNCKNVVDQKLYDQLKAEK